MNPPKFTEEIFSRSDKFGVFSIQLSSVNLIDRYVFLYLTNYPIQSIPKRKFFKTHAKNVYAQWFKDREERK